MTGRPNRSTVVIDNAIKRAAQLAAAREGISMSRYLDLALADYMARHGHMRTVTLDSRTITPKPEIL